MTLASLLHRCRYRARVERVESAAKVHVFYIDYGNVSTHSWEYFTPDVNSVTIEASGGEKMQINK